MKKRSYEILSPVGNKESFYAAVNNGADAVYLGVKEFNARNNIQNFGIDEIKEIVEYAHIFDVKVYLAINILIKDQEMLEALNIAKKAYLSGVDAFIVQDLGFATTLKKCIPEAELHASTQMGIHNLEGAKFLEGLGFSRVVLSRETSLKEIKRIKEGTNLEVEYFVQGALCVAFSGNCYLSSLLCSKSGNRGECKQLCRLPYLIENMKEEGFYLSAKDFCMLPMLKELAEAGVDSFKIEGRARRPSYVAIATRIYKQAVESDFKFSDKDIEDLKKSFNRGDFIKGYLSGEKIIDEKIQGHKGIKVGKVIKVEKGKRFNLVTLLSDHEISKGDGLKFIKDGKEVASLGVGDVKKIKNNTYVVSTATDVKLNSDVYLTLDYKFEENALKNIKKLKLNAIFNAKLNKKAELILKYKDISVAVKSKNIFEEANSQPLNYSDLFTQLSKITDFPFIISELNANLDNVFARKSEINEMRREGLKLLKEAILNQYKKEEINCDFNPINNFLVKNNKKQIYKLGILQDLEKISNFNNILLVYSPEEFHKEEIKVFSDFCAEKSVDGYLDLPIIASEEDLHVIKDILNTCDNLGILANNYYALNLVHGRKVIVGMGLNVYNSYTINFYEKLGCNDIVLSKEIGREESTQMRCNVNLYAFAQGREEYMTLKHCPFKEFFGSSCGRCTYSGKKIYKMQNGKKLLLERKRIVNCQFVLKSLDIREREVHVNKFIEII